MSRTRTTDPSAAARTMMSAKSFGSVNVPVVCTGKVSTCPVGDGEVPISPTA